MKSAKERMIELISDQPEDMEYDELLRELAFKRMVDHGLEDYKNSRTISNDEMARRIQSWQK